MGLLNRVVEPSALMKETEALVQEILDQAPLAVKMTWDAMHRGLDLPLDESARLGADYFGRCRSTEDFRKGTTAFIKKKKRRFMGR